MSMRLTAPLTHAHFLAVRSRTEEPPTFPVVLLAVDQAAPAQVIDAENLLELIVAPHYQSAFGPVIVLCRQGGAATPPWDLAGWHRAGYDTEYVSDPFSVERRPAPFQTIEG